jgi:membrane associated rhomboid family serine protease
VGASGAIFGLMGAAVVVMRNRGINPMESGLPLWIGLNLLFTFTVPGISIGGHIGGLIGGAACMLVLSRFGRGHGAYGRIGAIGIAGVVAVAALSVAIAYWKVRGYA